MSRLQRRLAVGLTSAAASACLALACADLSGLSTSTSGDAPDGAFGSDSSADGSPEGAAQDGSRCAADLMNDPKNCGRCGHDCLAPLCAAGACEPVLLAERLARPSAMVLGPSDVYVTTSRDGRVWSVSKSGGAQTDLAAAEPNAHGVALSGTTLFWANQDLTFDDAGSKGGVWRCELPACTTKRLVVAAPFAQEPVVGGGTVYFGGNSDSLFRAPAEGDGVPIVVGTGEAFATALDDQAVYHAGFGSLARTPLVDGGTGQTERLLFAQDSGGFIALDEARIYWAFVNNTGGHVISLAKASPGVNSISYGVPAGSINPVGIAVDDDYVYWSTGGTNTGTVPSGDGKVLACPKKGCSPSGPIVLATGNRGGGPLVADAKELYWLETGSGDDGRLRKVAKP